MNTHLSLNNGKLLLAITGLAILYFLAGRIGLLLAIPPGYATAVWPASGFALAGLLLYGPRAWPGVLIGSFCVNLTTAFDPSDTETLSRALILPFSIGIGASLQALLGYALLNRYVVLERGLTSIGEILRFYALSGPLSCLVSASWGIASLLLAGKISLQEAAFSWMTWWVGDTIGVVLGVPLLLLWLGKPRKIWKQRRRQIATPMVVTLLLSITLFVASSNLEQSRIEGQFNEQAATIGLAVNKELTKYTEILYSLHNLPNYSKPITGKQFENYTMRAIQRNPGIHALSWNPVVSAAERAAFEQSLADMGYPGFQITERNNNGELVSAKPRDQYVVVAYIQPMNENNKALGYDVYSNPSRKQALDQAMLTGKPVATAPIRLVQETGYQMGFLLFLPVYQDQTLPTSNAERRQYLTGFIVGVFRAGDMLGEAIRGLSLPNIQITVSDASNITDTALLAHIRFNQSGASETLATATDKGPIQSNSDDSNTGPQLSWENALEVGQRKWLLSVSATPQYFIANRSWTAWWILTAALLFSSLLGLMLLVLTGHSIENRERAAILTSEVEHRKRIEKSLKQSQEKYDLAMQVTRDGLWDWDIPNDEFEYSPSWSNLLEQDHLDTSYEAWKARIHPEDRTEVLNALEMHLNGKSDSWAIEHRLLKEDSSSLWVLNRGQVVSRDDAGKPLRMVGTTTDISERKHTEQTKERLHRELQQTRKMEALGQLTGGIAHDFNNILGIILGYTNMSLDLYRSQLPEKVTGYLQTSVKAAERAKDLIAKMLTFSRNAEDIPQPTPIVPLVKESMQMLQSILPSSIAIQLQTKENLPDILIAPEQLQQLLINLCINAKDAMQEVGTLSITVDWAKDVNAECTACHQWVEGDWIQLSVADTGSGMDDSTLEHLFEPFFTTKDVGKGTGMGMAVLHGIISNLGAHVLVNTEEGKGTRFQILFSPVAQAQHQPALNPLPESKPPEGNQSRVLVVDDEPELAHYIADLFQQHGYRPTVLTDSLEASTLLRSDTEQFALLVTDQTMPGFTGIELIQLARDIYPGFPAILCSGYSESIDMERAERRGIRYMDKPVDSAKLLRLAGELLGIS